MFHLITLLTGILAALVHAIPIDYPVCVVGAGPAGLTAANNLESKGFKTVIFEKQPEVGGKCQAYYDK
jgi:heterodisulfide reductase subunit A-like polyferredoxin